MARRLLTLIAYLLRQLLFSLPGLIYILMALAFWRLFFDPGQETPETAYYILVIGLFGAAAAFLITLTISGRANQAINYAILARLPSRVEHLVSVLVSSLFATLSLQFLVAILATVNGPALTFSRILELPPLWMAADLLAVVLALHATDLVTSGWSRVYVYGFLAILLFGRQLDGPLVQWVSNRLFGLSVTLMGEGYMGPGNLVNSVAEWLVGSGAQLVARLFDAVFWPFRAISDAVVSGAFTPVQALAPAVIIIYATVLFVLAADFFASKDIFLTE